MRLIYIVIVILFAVAIVVFAYQNQQTATVAFFGLRLQAPLALMAIVIYLLGMVTGSSLLALLRRSIAGARHR